MTRSISRRRMSSTRATPASPATARPQRCGRAIRQQRRAQRQRLDDIAPRRMPPSSRTGMRPPTAATTPGRARARRARRRAAGRHGWRRSPRRPRARRPRRPPWDEECLSAAGDPSTSRAATRRRARTSTDRAGSAMRAASALMSPRRRARVVAEGDLRQLGGRMRSSQGSLAAMASNIERREPRRDGEAVADIALAVAERADCRWSAPGRR